MRIFACFIAVAAAGLTWAQDGPSESDDLMSAVKERYETCRNDETLPMAADSAAPGDAFLDDRDLETLFEGVSANEIINFDCYILDHILVNNQTCPRHTSNSSLTTVRNRMANNSIDFKRMIMNLRSLPLVFHSYNGTVPGGNYSPSAGEIRINDLFTCLPAAMAAKVMGHEYVHAYIKELLEENTYTGTEEALAELLGAHFTEKASMASVLQCDSMNLDDSALTAFIKENACEKIQQYKSNDWEAFIEWVVNYASEENGDLDFNRAGSYIYAGQAPAGNDPCQLAKHHLKKSLNKMEGANNPLPDFQKSVKFHAACDSSD